MDVFKIKRVVVLNYIKKVAISGIIVNDIEKSMSEFTKLIINNAEVPIREVNEVLIDNNFYIAFTFDLDTLDTILLQDIMKLKEGYELEII
ncbi:hypothetical protein ACTJIV_11450 [Chryseobacterium sp. 22532]|uniref:hypothetical protein n=1 Tax=Chryseobacterium sp. 22532 TaxID=3453938 RepID=UPI003F86D31C